jgi:phenylacetate-CoA ligase
LNLRNLSFRIYKFIFNKQIKRDIESITISLSNLNTVIRDSALKSLFEIAKSEVPFYKNIGDQINIENFPVVNKGIIKENVDSFISSRFNKNELLKVVTSGSTGTPFEVYHDRRKKIRNSADTIVFSKLAGYEIGVKLYFVKIWNLVNQKSKLIAYLQNIKSIDITQISDTRIEYILDEMNKDASPKCILGYASAVESMASFIERRDKTSNINYNIHSIITMSEGLSSVSRSLIKKSFNCNVVSRYSNVENGIIAQQRIDTEYFVINSASYFIEIMDLNIDVLLDDGKIGRIIITDLYNHAMPMIRYDTGDIGALGIEQQTGARILLSVNGRMMDAVYNTKGELVSSFTITNQMWKYPEILQYQFIQKSKKEYTFKLNLTSGFTRELELISEFKTYFGSDAIILIEYVKEIPLLSSGKRRKVVNEMLI